MSHLTEKLPGIINDNLFQVFLSDETCSVCSRNCLLDLKICRIWLPVKNIVFDAAVKQDGLLHNKSHPLPQLCHPVHLDVNSIDENLAELWVVEAHHEADQGRLTTARDPDNCSRFARPHLQTQALEDPSMLARWVRISEPNILEFDFASESLVVDRGQRFLIVTFHIYFRRLLDFGKDTVGCLSRCTDIRPKLHCLSSSEGAEQDAEERDEHVACLEYCLGRPIEVHLTGRDVKKGEECINRSLTEAPIEPVVSASLAISPSLGLE